MVLPTGTITMNQVNVEILSGCSKSGENYKTVWYEKIIPLLIEAIREQQEQITYILDELENIKKDIITNK